MSELRCENQDLKKENQALWEKLTNLTLIVSDIKTKSKEMENERLSLITTIRLMQIVPLPDKKSPCTESDNNNTDACTKSDNNNIDECIQSLIKEKAVETNNNQESAAALRECTDNPTDNTINTTYAEVVKSEVDLRNLSKTPNTPAKENYDLKSNGELNSDSLDGFTGVERKRKKYKSFFLSGIAEGVKESYIHSYLAKRNIISTNVSIFRSKRIGTMSAKIHIPSALMHQSILALPISPPGICTFFLPGGRALVLAKLSRGRGIVYRPGI